MTIEISKATEALVQQATERGKFGTVEAFLSAVASDYLQSKTPEEERNVARSQREQSWKDFRKPLDLEALAKEQGVQPIAEPSDLKFDDWPEDDSVEDFIRRAKGLDAPAGPGGTR